MKVFVARRDEVFLVQEQRTKKCANHEVETQRFADGAKHQHKHNDNAEQRFGAKHANHGFRKGLYVDVALIKPVEQLVKPQHHESHGDQLQCGNANGHASVAKR